MKLCGEVKFTWELAVVGQAIVMHVRNIIVFARHGSWPIHGLCCGPMIQLT